MKEQMKKVPMNKIDFIGNIRNDDIEIEELTASIKLHGLLQPIVVSPIGDKFNLVAGHRRFKACDKLGWKVIPAVIREFQNNRIIQLTENMQRCNMTRADEARTLTDLKKELGVSKLRLAKVIGKSINYVDMRLSYYRVREFLIGSGLFQQAFVNQMTYDVARTVEKHPRKYWSKMCSHLIGKRWHTAQIQHFCNMVVDPNYKPPEKTQKAGKYIPKKNSKNQIDIDLANSMDDEFSIMIDKRELIIKLLCPSSKSFKQLTSLLEKVGGEVI